ncbi:hypothetical protein AGDE_12741 [Angomonas deanei]|nr:hypothetical protein AGDE_12741 [Angomonas deanei]|eukprot:EPY23603.1 hypothetical protein AGDE_12741 [Angomonas deanei]
MTETTPIAEIIEVTATAPAATMTTTETGRHGDTGTMAIEGGIDTTTGTETATGAVVGPDGIGDAVATGDRCVHRP